MSSAAAVVPGARSIIYLGMDVHKEPITIAALATDAKAPTRVDRLPNDLVKLKRWLERVAMESRQESLSFAEFGVLLAFDRARLQSLPILRFRSLLRGVAE